MKYEIDPDEKAVNAVMARNSKALAKKYQMRPFAVTVAMPGGDIQYLELKFQIKGPLSKEQMRNILIEAAHDFLKDINSDSALCFYLKNNSLTIKDIGITLFLIDHSGRDLDDPHIGIAKISKGKLRYDILIETYNEVLKFDIPQLKSKSTETYEEALHILNDTPHEN
jgi:hypothetical protein